MSNITTDDLVSLDHIVLVTYNGFMIEQSTFSRESYGDNAIIEANTYAVKQAMRFPSATIKVAAIYRTISKL